MRIQDFIKVVSPSTRYRIFTCEGDNWTDVTMYYLSNPERLSEILDNEIYRISVDIEKIEQKYYLYPNQEPFKVYIKCY